MVTLSVPFRNEIVDVVVENKLIHIYDTKVKAILEARKALEANNLMEELKALCYLENERLTTTDTEEEANQITLNIPLGDDTATDNIDDFDPITFHSIYIGRT